MRLLVCAIAGLLALAFGNGFLNAAAHAEEIVLRGELYDAGTYEVDGREPACGRTRTILTADLGDYGASIGAFIVLNPVKLDRLSAATRLFIYSHECAHQLFGKGEERADCYAAKRGKKEGWLKEADIDQVCRIFPHTSKSPEHPDRQARCDNIRACYAKASAPSFSPVRTGASALGNGPGGLNRPMH